MKSEGAEAPMSQQKPDGANAPERQQLIEPDSSAGPQPRRVVWRLALTASAVASAVAGAAAVTSLRQRVAPQTSVVDSLRKPFKLYDAAADPNLLPMPDRSDKYNGWEDKRPIKVVDKNGTASVFVIGDWGATLPNHITFGAGGTPDQYAQMTVADAFKKRATWADPQYVLNVGDNFYVDGLPHTCQEPPAAVQGAGTTAFSQGWQSVYGPTANIPWLSVLGNHDYGGYLFTRGWPQQIGYSFVNYNWIMPARYFNKIVQHSNFKVEYFMIDSNAFDAKNPGENPDHNICSSHNNGGIGTCWKNGGMPNIGACRKWFWDDYAIQKGWLEKKLKESTADWKVVVTHFPCGYDSGFYKSMKAKYGLDLLVTGHRHQQELWKPTTTNKYIQSFFKANQWDGSAPTCFVTGGGGGIASQKFQYATYGTDLLWYGFFHLTINKDWLQIELVNTDGVVHGKHTIHPRGSAEYEKESQFTLEGVKGDCASYCGNAQNPWAKVCGWQTCAGCDGCN